MLEDLKAYCTSSNMHVFVFAYLKKAESILFLII